MRLTFTLFICCFLFSLTSWAGDAFEMPLPDEAQPSSAGFVNSFQSETNTMSAPSAAAPSHRESQPQEEDGTAYERAFSSYHSKKTSDEDKDPSEEWQKSQAKPDSFDIDNMTFSEPAAAPQPQREVRSSRRAPAAAGSASYRAPAEENSKKTSLNDNEIPPPEGVDLNKELNALDHHDSSSASEADSGGGNLNAKDRKALVMRTISENYADLKGCYNDGLKKSSHMKGKVVMAWAMDVQGRVSGAEVETSQLNNKQVEQCMVDRLSSWRFPRQAKVAGSKDRMSYTFQFIPEKD